MRKTIVAILVALPTSALAFDVDAVKQRCATEWQGDFQMQAFCVKQQKEGFDKVEAVRPTLDETMQGVLARCEADWSPDHQMTAFCIDQQIDARAAVTSGATGVPDEVAQDIRAGCEREWGEDFQMLKFCIDQQAKAWHELNG